MRVQLKVALILFFYPLIFCNKAISQTIQSVEINTEKGLSLYACTFSSGQTCHFRKSVPLFTFNINNEPFYSETAQVIREGNTYSYQFPNRINGELFVQPDFEPGWKAVLTIKNGTNDTLELSNVVPFGISDEHTYITATGPQALARTKIFRPDLAPVGVILPDNAWEMGYASLEIDDTYSICAIARRTKYDNSQRKRYQTIIPPGGSVEYTFYADVFSGEWQNGLKLIFQERYLYDLEEFDNSMFERKDLKWIRNKYIMTLQFAWDHNFYDSSTGKYNFFQYLEEGKKLFGGYDVFGIWPTWPRLGVDQRNQWDLYEDLPFGLEKLKELANYAHVNSVKFFITFNPWDQSTREEDPYKGMARLIQATNADGVVLDTRGSSSLELQHTADSVKEGVIMYSEGMAIPKDMPGIVSGRVHDAIFMPPLLNLNKLIKPEFAIFRVCQLSQGRIHREIAISFFNGYGTEINTFAPGRPGWMEEEYLYLGRTTKILRENSSVFLNTKWTPLIPDLKDSIWVNRWQNENKVLYTVFSLLPQGYQGPLFEQDTSRNYHFVSLWNHNEIDLIQENNNWYVPVMVKEFNKSWLNTRREGNVECIAKLPNILKVNCVGDSLFVEAPVGDKILLWKGKPSYQGVFREFDRDILKLKVSEIFGRYEGKLVVQLFDENELIDERIADIKSGIPWLISIVRTTKTAKRPPKNMVEIPEGEFSFQVSNPDQFIPYPDYSEPELIHVRRFFMDKYPVTNEQFYEFIQNTQYIPEDPKNYLKHWKNGVYPFGQEKYPVVYVSLEDARAYAEWAGKRLPSEIEWQYAAQGTDGRKWPWGDEFHGTKCNNGFDRPTPVNAFSKGKSPFKVEDMVGNVWQLTNDVYDNGSYYFAIIRGGSYYKPTSSSWYVQGGPQPLDRTQMLLLVTPGFDRNATVGFRCVRDAE
jgi:iron(II)-dependent oxidoreductase